MRYHIKIKQAKYEIYNKKNINEDNENSEETINNLFYDILSESEDYSINNDKINIDISIINSKKEENQLVYIKNYFRDKYAKIIILSDDIIQIIFNDNIQIFISEKIGIGYVNRDKTITFLPLTNIKKNSNKDFVHRFSKIRRIYYQIIRNKYLKKINGMKKKN